MWGAWTHISDPRNERFLEEFSTLPPPSSIFPVLIIIMAPKRQKKIEIHFPLNNEIVLKTSSAPVLIPSGVGRNTQFGLKKTSQAFFGVR